jgi:hypothetical protein
MEAEQHDRREDVPKNSPPELAIRNWRGKCAEEFSRLGYLSVDEFIEGIRDR